MFRPLLSILGLLVLLAIPATGSTTPLVQPTERDRRCAST